MKSINKIGYVNGPNGSLTIFKLDHLNLFSLNEMVSIFDYNTGKNYLVRQISKKGFTIYDNTYVDYYGFNDQCTTGRKMYLRDYLKKVDNFQGNQYKIYKETFEEQIVKPMIAYFDKNYNCYSQYKCGKRWHVDLMIKSTVGRNVVVEVDENNHIGYDFVKESRRQKSIEETENCVFVRINPNKKYDIKQEIVKIEKILKGE